MKELVVSATTSTFESLIRQATNPVLVDFWAAWCQPCLRVSPLLQSLAEEHSDTLTVLKINVDEEPALACQYGIQSIPTIIRFDGGQETRRVIGALPKSVLVSRLGLGVEV